MGFRFARDAAQERLASEQMCIDTLLTCQVGGSHEPTMPRTIWVAVEAWWDVNIFLNNLRGCNFEFAGYKLPSAASG